MCRVRQVDTGPIACDDFGDAKIEQLHDAVRRDGHIGGLQVAMGYSLLVRRLECVGDLVRIAQDLLEAQARAA